MTSTERTERRRWPLQLYFALPVAVFVVAAGAAAIFVHVQGGRDARAQAERDARFAARTAAGQLGTDLGTLRSSLRALAANPQIGRSIAQPAGCTLTYTGYGGSDRGHLDIMRNDGTVVCSSRARSASGGLGSYAGAPWLERAKSRPLFVAPVRDPLTGKQVAISTVPVPGRGVIGGFFDLETVGPHLASLYGGGRPVVFLIANRAGTKVIARSRQPARWIGTSLAGTDFARFPDRVERRDLEGDVRLYRQATVPGTGWQFHVGQDKGDVLAAGGRLERRQLWIILAGLAGILLAAAFVYRRVAVPIARLGADVRFAGDHGPPEPVPVPRGDAAEIASLRSDVNALIASVNRELDERRRAEEQVARLAEIVESSDDAIVGQAPDGTITSWNAGAERMSGFPAGEMVGRRLAGLLAPERADDVREWLGLRPGDVRRAETVWIRSDGEPIDVALTISPIPGPGGAITGISTIARDVSERRRAEEALRRSEESYRILFDRHPAPMWVFDPDTLRFLAVNDTAVASYGYARDEFLSMTVLDIRPPEDQAALLEAIGELPEGRVQSGVWRHVRKDGSVIDAAVTSSAIDLDRRAARIVVAQDVTEQRRLAEQLRQAQKMEAVGSLAGGIAHDFDNIVMVIRTCSALLLNRLDDASLRGDVVQIDTAAARAAGLTHQLLAFSRQQILRPKVTDLNAVVDDIVGLLQRLLGEDVEIVRELGPDVEPVVVDPSQLGQVLLNLAVNARDAMPTGGTLAIRTANITLDESYAAEHVGVEPGPHVVLQVDDTGVGMDEETRNRIFDPFYTTKEAGTGLGLATVYGIVTQSGGHIWVYSEPSMGTSFKVYFPAAGVAPRAPTPAREVTSLEGEETILLVEDDALLRPLMAESLRDLGYDVIDAGSGEEALRLAAQRDVIDVLVTDVVMPLMNGREVAERVRAARPGIRVLFSSGYPADTILRHGIAEESAAYIEKPYLPDDLARAIRELLAAEPAI